MIRMWTSISIDNLRVLIRKRELELNDQQLKFWNQIKIEPEKWEEIEYGNEGGGFWVVAIFRSRVIYYNDIEEGFNISPYKTYGKIEEYWCSQDDLNWSVLLLMNTIMAK